MYQINTNSNNNVLQISGGRFISKGFLCPHKYLNSCVLNTLRIILRFNVFLLRTSSFKKAMVSQSIPFKFIKNNVLNFKYRFMILLSKTLFAKTNINTSKNSAKLKIINLPTNFLINYYKLI